MSGANTMEKFVQVQTVGQTFETKKGKFVALRDINLTIKKGEWTVIHDGGQAGIGWAELVYNTEKEGKIPAGTTISFQMRAANVKADLAATPWIETVGGVPDVIPNGRFVEIRARLLITEDDVDVSPVLSDVCVLPDI